MGSDPRAVDADGVRVERDARVQVLIAGGVAVALVAVATIVALVVLADDPPRVAAAPAPAVVADAARAPVHTPTRARRRDAAGDPDAPAPASRRARREAARAAAATEPAGERPELSLKDVLPYLPTGEAREGIALFPAPGTDPPKRGLVVPEDFPLPEGFLRHYQATDDGVALPPILMLHPDYELVDDAGKAIALPGGVVPPELAPPGMPHETLEMPASPRPAD
jgi:hypothetical protein